MVASSAPLVEAATSYTLSLASHKDDSLFVMNAGNYSFPLALLHLGDGAGALDGSEWQYPYLLQGMWLYGKMMEAEAPEIDCDLERNEGNVKGQSVFGKRILISILMVFSLPKT